MEKDKIKNLSGQDIQALSGMLTTRATLAAKLGQSYGGDRDIYQALGYKTDLFYEDYTTRYTRQDIAKAIIDRPVKATWQGDLEIIETDDAEVTPFEKEWKKLDLDLKITSKLTRVDRLTGIGKYGIVLLGLDDVKTPDDFAKEVKTGKRKLLYIKPFGEGNAKISTFEERPTNPRYGLPVLYDVQVLDMASKASSVVKVHHTRMIHILDDTLESEIYGIPRLEAVFNRLMDLEKLVGGDAEMFWRGARPGYQGKVDSDYQMTAEGRAELKEQVDEYENNLRRIIVNEGVDLQALAQQIADPKNHVDVQFQLISAVTGIPKRILTGSERGELSSAQDSGEWKTFVQARREDHAEPDIIRPFINRLIELGILSTPKETYKIKWLDLFSISEKERVEIGKGRANALREYASSPMAEAIIPPQAFLEKFLGLSKDDIELINKQRDEGLSEQEKELMKEIQAITNPTPIPKEGNEGGEGSEE
jgi:hypothetical protein